MSHFQHNRYQQTRLSFTPNMEANNSKNDIQMKEIQIFLFKQYAKFQIM